MAYSSPWPLTHRRQAIGLIAGKRAPFPLPLPDGSRRIKWRADRLLAYHSVTHRGGGNLEYKNACNLTYWPVFDLYCTLVCVNKQAK